MRDLTRGGVGATLHEIVDISGKQIILEEGQIPVLTAVRGVSELLGFDPLYLANEGKAVIIIDESVSEDAVKDLRKNPLGINATVIGEVTDERGPLLLRTSIGGLRAVDYPSGEQLPRIC